jgi:hypothetical protein
MCPTNGFQTILVYIPAMSDSGFGNLRKPAAIPRVVAAGCLLHEEQDPAVNNVQGWVCRSVENRGKRKEIRAIKLKGEVGRLAAEAA